MANSKSAWRLAAASTNSHVQDLAEELAKFLTDLPPRTVITNKYLSDAFGLDSNCLITFIVLDALAKTGVITKLHRSGEAGGGFIQLKDASWGEDELLIPGFGHAKLVGRLTPRTKYVYFNETTFSHVAVSTAVATVHEVNFAIFCEQPMELQEDCTAASDSYFAMCQRALTPITIQTCDDECLCDLCLHDLLFMPLTEDELPVTPNLEEGEIQEMKYCALDWSQGIDISGVLQSVRH